MAPDEVMGKLYTPDTSRGVVSTIENKCRQCYSCIRNCPVKAIGVKQGQAWVMSERCIACGNCVRMCAQNAKRIQDGASVAKALLGWPEPVVLILAPSFPAAFKDIDPGKVIAASKKLGFSDVIEVAFGAELVSRAYKKVLKDRPEGPLIATPCPTLVKYIEKYHPKLVPFFVPVVSPMIAAARAVKEKYKPGAKVVFAGPCVSKKLEREETELAGDVDAVLTFAELKSLFDEAGIDPEAMEPVEFDGPAARLGRIYPVSGGLLRTAGLQNDILNDEMIVAEGHDRVPDVLESIEKGTTKAKFFDLLFCEGCINGPLMPAGTNLTERKEIVAEFARKNAKMITAEELEKVLAEYDDVDLTRRFGDEHMDLKEPTEEEIRAILHEIKKDNPEDELNCGACGYRTCREKAKAVYQGIAENEMCLPYIIDQLIEYNERMKEAQQKIFRVEKLASIGRLAAGIAHEINNPLSGIMLFANILDKSLKDDEQKAKLRNIIDETLRAREIVKGVLDFSRQTNPKFEPVDAVELLNRVFALLEKQSLLLNINVKKPYLERRPPMIRGDKMQLQQVLLNIVINAVQAISGEGEIVVDIANDNGFVDINVTDNGCGINEEDLNRIFDPFFSTKGSIKGTGLGLSLSHGIVDKHGGSIIVKSAVGKGSTFTIRLPVMHIAETNDIGAV